MCQIDSEPSKPACCPPPPVSPVLEEHFMPLVSLRESGLGEGNMLSITQNNICLPARALRTINKIRQRTKATVPLLPPHVCFSFSSLCSLPFCFSSFASTMQTFSGLSSPPLLRELAHKPLLMHSWQHTCLPRHKHTHGCVN